MRPEASPDLEPAASPEDELRDAFMTAFCTVLHDTQMMPMQVMAMAAAAMGSIYREVADAHLVGDACPCGWQPRTAEDVAELQALLAASAGAVTAFDLRNAVVAGQA